MTKTATVQEVKDRRRAVRYCHFCGEELPVLDECRVWFCSRTCEAGDKLSQRVAVLEDLMKRIDEK